MPYRPGAPLRICTAADDAEAEAREAAAVVATLRRVLEREAREAEAMAAAVMGGQWLRPVQPVRVEPMAG